MDLATFWFIVLGVLWTGYLVLEGFDFGVGMLMPVLGGKRYASDAADAEKRRRVLLNTIGPVWDGNEVWVLTAGGATFAAFPHWYATLFSGFYLPLLLILVALIVRNLGFEYRHKRESTTWKSRWDLAIVVGSFVPALLWGVAFTNIVRGVPIDANKEFVGNLWTLLNPMALLGGLVTLSLFLVHGALFGALGANLRDREGWAFIGTFVCIAFAVATLFLALFPDVMPSTIDPAYSLTTTNASSTDYTLKIMTIVALIFTPIVLLYQGWTYWVFRKRIAVHHIPA